MVAGVGASGAVRPQPGPRLPCQVRLEKARIGNGRGVSPEPPGSPPPPAERAEGGASRSPLVSVVIPTRDRAREVERAVSAALAQREVALEVLVVDDGSREPVALRSRDNRVRVLRLGAPGGVSKARNHGIAAAAGTWVAFLDDDDIWAPDRLRRLLDPEVSAGADVLLSGTLELDRCGHVLAVDTGPRDTGFPLAELLWSQNVVGGPSGVMVRRSLLEQQGGFDPAFSVLADWELWIRLAARGRFAVCRDLLNGYVVHEQGMHVTSTDQAVAEFFALAARHGMARRAEDPGMYAEHFLRWAARAHRRAGRRRAAAALYWRAWRMYRVPSDLARAGIAPLGETAMRWASRAPRRSLLAAPEWVRLYQGEPGGQLRPIGATPTTSRGGPACTAGSGA
jgi:glycosyltransferase involved in cell wall biosynthesis